MLPQHSVTFLEVGVMVDLFPSFDSRPEEEEGDSNPRHVPPKPLEEFSAYTN